MSDAVRVGVLGTGAISQIVHLPILAERDDIELVALADPDVHKARALGDRFGVERIMRDEELITDDEIEAIFVCTPNYLHERQALAALDAGKDVLVERPIALTAEGARRVAERAGEAGRTAVVGMSHRWRPDVSALRAFVAGGELGEPYALRGSWLNRRLPFARRSWRQRPEEAGGGALMDLGVQALDLLLWIVDYPEAATVRAITHTHDLEVEDAATLLITTRSGMAVSVEVSWGYFASDDRHHVRVMGLEGTGSLPPLAMHRQVGGRPMDVTPRQPIPRGGENAYTNAYRREIDHFIRTVSGPVSADPPTEQEALMAVVEAAYRSAREGREVEL